MKAHNSIASSGKVNMLCDITMLPRSVNHSLEKCCGAKENLKYFIGEVMQQIDDQSITSSVGNYRAC
jgi:hypothetical protein